MDYTTLGRTGLTVSVAGLGCGGFSRLGLSHGKTEAEAADIVRTALDLGINYIDTAEAYETEGAVGIGIGGRDRGTLVIATKGRVHRRGELYSAVQIAYNVDASLKRLKTDYIDVYQPHAPNPENFKHLMEVVLPVLLRARESGKIRHIGLTESGDDPHHRLLLHATAHADFEVMLLAFHMMHQNARNELLPRLQTNQTGAVGMYAVRNIFARDEALRTKVSELCAAGQLPAELDGKENPLDFLIHDGGAQTVADAAYRFVRHQVGVNVVVFGTGNPQHVHSNVASIIKPPLPAKDIEKIHTLFGHLVGVGLDPTPRAINRKPLTPP